jgi:hypothetical protein
MIRIAAALAISTALAGSAFAAGVTCSTSPESQFKSKTDLEAMLTADGLKLKKLKVEKGCYEVYAIDKAGKKVNVAYNAETLEKVDNPEAGEN